MGGVVGVARAKRIKNPRPIGLMKKKEIKYLDKLWAEKVKKRANYKCEYCGKTKYLNAHHIYSRSNRSVRWDVRNGICLCVGCHSFANHSAHKAPLDFVEWVTARRGDKWLEELREAKNALGVQMDYKTIREGLKDGD
jgi:5-methylcytosine-specific restriction endonuclease McrA